MCFYLGKNAFSALRSLLEGEGFVWQQMELCVFRRVVPFGATRFFILQKEGKQMKKTISLLLALVLCLSLCACGSNTEKEAPTEKSAPEQLLEQTP